MAYLLNVGWMQKHLCRAAWEVCYSGHRPTEPLHDVPHLTELGSPPGEMEQSCCKDLKERMHATLGKGKTGSAQEGWEGQVRSEEILNTKMGWQPTPLMRAM